MLWAVALSSANKIFSGTSNTFVERRTNHQLMLLELQVNGKAIPVLIRYVPQAGSASPFVPIER